MESVRQRGAKILAEPKEFPGARFAYVGAPDGVIIELLEHRQWAAFLGPDASAQSRHGAAWPAGMSAITPIASLAIIPSREHCLVDLGLSH